MSVNLPRSRCRRALPRSYLDHLHGTQEDVGKELGRPGRGRVHDGAVPVAAVLAERGRVEVLENLVEAELAGPLEAVPDEGGGPPLDQSHGRFFSNDGTDPRQQSGVLCGVHLLRRSKGMVRSEKQECYDG